MTAEKGSPLDALQGFLETENGVERVKPRVAENMEKGEGKSVTAVTH
ncbi:MAG TPA: hypothetical protein PKK59_09330 [Anaerolineaceae bacterium]|nr:hypothetical protein [Anaerolineaceae bacterium]